MTAAEVVIWHDLECGGYERDLPLWLSLADAHAHQPGATILDVGCGSGRVALALARAGHRVVGLDHEQALLDALGRRSEGLAIQTVRADAREFSLAARFALCIVPMQTLQLLGGRAGREAFMRTVAGHLTDDGALALAIAPQADFEQFEWHEGDPYPLPDIAEHDGTVYSSQPTAVRLDDGTFILERRREIIDAAGRRLASEDRITLDIVSSDEVQEAGLRAGLRTLGVQLIPPTTEHIGSEVIVLAA